MITIISGTNRSDSLTAKYARHLMVILTELGQEAHLLDLAEVELELLTSIVYHPAKMSPALKELQAKYVLGAQKIIILAPEYNGSFPGVLKLLIDGISVNEYAGNFTGKVTALVGISSGRAGNLRGLDHLAEIISHMGGWVLPNRLPISLADQKITNGLVSEEATLAALKQQAQQLIAA